MTTLSSAPVAVPVLELRGISKAFTGVQALSGVSLNLYPGEVHTLMGQNGAGKSTLIKVLTGVYSPDQGEILLEGRAIHPQSTLDAQNLGISTVYQEVNLCPNLSVAENIFIGRYPRKLGGIDWTGMQQQAVQLLAHAGADRCDAAACALSAGDPADGGDLARAAGVGQGADTRRADFQPG
jgi:monosaccharide-transporting ATPase